MKASKFAILGDIHGNWPALEAVLEDAERRGATRIVCVGDIVGYNSDPVRCVEKIMELDCVVVQGNHDYYCSRNVPLHDFHPLAAEVILWTRRQLSDRHVAFLHNLDLVARFAGVTVVHSTLDMPERWGYVFDTIEAEAHFTYQATAACVYGHTHLPMVFERGSTVSRKPFTRVRMALGSKYFINVGSVGQPRDGDPRAAYALYDSATQVFELCRVPYDIGLSQDGIRKAGLPERLALRLQNGR